jgi:hypothetical protein
VQLAQLALRFPETPERRDPSDQAARRGPPDPLLRVKLEPQDQSVQPVRKAILGTQEQPVQRLRVRPARRVRKEIQETQEQQDPLSLGRQEPRDLLASEPQDRRDRKADRVTLVPREPL